METEISRIMEQWKSYCLMKNFSTGTGASDRGTARVPENYLTICYTLHETDNSTNLELEHKNLKSEKMYLEMLNVWDFLLSSLKSYVEQK